MKWFKHSCTARDDQKISKLMDELGLEGYGCYMIILEVVGHEMGPTNECFAEFSLKKWGSFTQLSAKRFQKFAEVMAKLSLFHAEILEKNCKIEIPNLLKYRDNHTKNLQVANKKVSLDKEKEKEKEEDKEKDTLDKSKGVAKATQTKKFNSEFDEMWPYLSGIPSNKNYETAKRKYACLRGNGYECEEIKRYYYEEHIKKADAPKFIKQFVLAVTLGNLKAWRKFEPVEMEKPKNNAEKISEALDELFNEEITA